MKADPLSALFAELGRLRELDRVEQELHRRGYVLVAGVDEAGRGALAGPVVAAAVILPLRCVLVGLDDSKRLDQFARERLARAIRERAIAVGVGIVSAAEIDVRDILRASLAAMRAAVLALDPPPEAVLSDAFAVPGVRLPQLPIIHGDALCTSVAAASVIAKVERDRILDDLGRRFPAYGFEHHKGYGTPEHAQALYCYGPCPEHRLTYHGVVAGSDARFVAGSGAGFVAGSDARIVAGRPDPEPLVAPLRSPRGARPRRGVRPR